MLSRFLLTAVLQRRHDVRAADADPQPGARRDRRRCHAHVGAVGWSAGSWVQGQHRFAGLRSWLVSVGGASLAVGVAGLAAVAGFDLPSCLVGVAAALCGTGMGLAMSSTSVLSLSLSPVVEHGRTSSSLQLADVLGSVMGIAAAGSVFAALHDGVRSDIPTFVLMWLVLAAVAALVVPGRSAHQDVTGDGRHAGPPAVREDPHRAVGEEAQRVGRERRPGGHRRGGRRRAGPDALPQRGHGVRAGPLRRALGDLGDARGGRVAQVLGRGSSPTGSQPLRGGAIAAHPA